jgi:hypothetical protein
MGRVASLALALVAILLLPGVGFAQEATIGGTITDSTRGVLPGVVVRAVHDATGTQFETVTDDRGVYRIPVRIGVYRIMPSYPALRPWSGVGWRSWLASSLPSTSS